MPIIPLPASVPVVPLPASVPIIPLPASVPVAPLPAAEDSTPSSGLPDERRVTCAIFTLESTCRNIYLKGRNRTGHDLRFAFKGKEAPLACILSKSKDSTTIKVILYEGLHRESSKCTAIRQITFECDAHHREIFGKSKDHRSLSVDLYFTVDSLRICTLEAVWKDTKEKLKVIENRPVPPGYRHASQEQDNASVEQSESQLSTPTAANSTTEGTHDDGMNPVEANERDSVAMQVALNAHNLHGQLQWVESDKPGHSSVYPMSDEDGNGVN